MNWNANCMPCQPDWGGLGISMPSITATQELHPSQLVTSTLCEHILSQDPEYGYEVIAKQLEAKTQVRQENHARNTTKAEELRDLLSDPLRRAVDLAKEKGSSTWLTALPLAEHGLPSTKGDALALRYGLTLSEMPSMCACGGKFTVEHVLSCAKGEFPTIRHSVT